MILLKNGIGQIYWPGYQIDQIGSWNIRHGYKIYMNNAATLTLTGNKIKPGETPVALPACWSLIACLGDAVMPTAEALASIRDHLVLAKNGAGEVYWPDYGINQLRDMQPGEGYQVYLASSGTLFYPDN